jgi:hypothetical protein
MRPMSRYPDCHRRKGIAIASTDKKSPYAGYVDAELTADVRQGIQSVEIAMTVLLALERARGADDADTGRRGQWDAGQQGPSLIGEPWSGWSGVSVTAVWPV